MNEDKKEILVVTPGLFGNGGVANYYKTIIPLLKDNEFSIGFLEIGSVRDKTNFLHPFTDQIRFQKHIKAMRPALIMVNPSFDPKSFIRDGMFVFQASHFNIPVIVFFHGWRKKFAQTVENFLLRIFRVTWCQANAFIVLASAYKKKLVSWNVSAPIYVETTTVDPKLIENFDIEKRVLSLKVTGCLRILFLARIEKAKGVFETVDAIAMLQRNGFPVRLTIAGDGSAKAELEKYIRNLGSSDEYIKCTGYVTGSEKIAAFLSHDLYCLPTYHDEGLPISLLEALAFGLPVLTCAAGGIENFFLDGKMGSLVPVRDAEAIANNIEKMASERKSMVRMARHNHAFAVQNLMAPTIASRIVEIYRKTIKNY